ncbi:hypothetical protein RclHR1_03460017 [Rhizophagus clarus]|uniref:Uncharacterized protein n=1 Tax=Rhizophagus clarus TaxID=94130 RepID=A0A2Z6S577_9GLOM|nr:hypothetical protein RclHR1_03460017 [Rhizophagus clarus]
MDKVRFFRRLRISQIIITAFICLIEKSRIYLYKRKPHFVDIPFNLTYTTLDFVDFVDCEYYIADNYERGLHLGNVSFDQAYISDSALDFVDCGITSSYVIDLGYLYDYHDLYIILSAISLILLVYNLFRAENQRFTSLFMRLFNIIDNYLDSILLVVWTYTAIINNTPKFFTNWDYMCHGFGNFNVILCASHVISYILCLLLFLSCIIRIVTKYGGIFNRSDDYEYTPLLWDYDLIDDDEYEPFLEGDVDAKLIDDEEITVKFIEFDKEKANVEKLIEIDDPEGK